MTIIILEEVSGHGILLYSSNGMDKGMSRIIRTWLGNDLEVWPCYLCVDVHVQNETKLNMLSQLDFVNSLESLVIIF